MKTAISIPDGVFTRADRLARRLKKSRSQLYSEAIEEYVARHGTDDVTEALDKVLETEPRAQRGFAEAAARRRLRETEW